MLKQLIKAIGLFLIVDLTNQSFLIPETNYCRLH
jgi:hypothetical protein